MGESLEGRGASQGIPVRSAKPTVPLHPGGIPSTSPHISSPPPRKTEPHPIGSGSLLKARTPPRSPKGPPELWGVGVSLGGPSMVTEAPNPPHLPARHAPVRPPPPTLMEVVPGGHELGGGGC